MKKKLMVCMLALTLAFSLTACGKDDKDVEKGAFKAEQQDKKDSSKKNTDNKNSDKKDADDKDLKEKDSEKKEDKEAEQVTAERGIFEGNVYTNKSMGIQATFPEGCTMYNDEEIEQVVGAGSKVMEDAYDSEAVENSLSGTIYDVIAVNADQTANIQIVMEDTASTVGMKLSAEQYVQAMTINIEKAYESAGVEMGEPEVSEENLGGLDFSVVTVAVNGMTQSYYAHQVDNYMLVFTMTYTDKTSVQQFLDSVTAI